MKVSVTITDIKRGTAGDGTYCAVARALCRASRAKGWYVGQRCSSRGYYAKSPDNRLYELSDDVCRFIRKIDDGGSVEPIAFEIAIPSPNRSKR